MKYANMELSFSAVSSAENPTQDNVWMRLALEQAHRSQQRGEVPVGAVLVRGAEVLALGHNQPIASHDPTAHAEIVALRAGAQHLGNYRLEECELYVTLEPCAMCAQAILHARLKRVVFGATEPKTGAAGSVLNLFDYPQLNHRTVVRGGVLANDCAALLRGFFQQRRQQAQQQVQPLRQDALRTPERCFASVWQMCSHWQPYSEYLYTLPALEGLRWHALDIPAGNDATQTPTVSVWLALHGPDAWWPQCAAWAQEQTTSGSRVLLPDVMGFGQSDKPKKWRWHTLERHAQMLAQWLQHLGLVGTNMVRLAVAPGQWPLAKIVQRMLPDTVADTVTIPAPYLWQGCPADWRDLPYPDKGHRAAQQAWQQLGWCNDKADGVGQ